MDRKLEEVLNRKKSKYNYILPFFWHHGEDKSVISDLIEKINSTGIKEICVESRPHPDFCGPSWWDDMDLILAEAKDRDMKVWVLDDAHFPTGFANAWIRDKYPEHKKIYLAERHIDVSGPLKGASILKSRWLNEGEKLLTVIASRRTGEDDAVDDTLLDLSNNVDGDFIYWDIPEGYWRVFLIIITPEGGAYSDYINPIDAESSRVLIDAVYEPHYSRYGDEFGKTFAGFFSDEPNIGNGKSFELAIGRNKKMVLPWSKGILDLLNDEHGSSVLNLLPGLWHDIGEQTWSFRYLYMNILSSLYGKNFAGQIGKWCCEHGVEYIGHVIEDNNAHSKLGRGTGHFFRALWGQDMSGLDVVLSQIRPGFDNISFSSATSLDPDGEFYHYGLAKMASSLAHIDPKKKGRTICEVFGAYGWVEGLKLMKWLIDHMLVRGVNYFVPHAFSPKKFPDRDCPPHFYAKGNNPQFRYFHLLSEYTNRICHLLNNGRHVAQVAVLYHAEAEWSGDCMLFQKPLRYLMQNQIDCDVLPIDIFEDAQIEGGEIKINNESYKALIIPYAERLPYGFLKLAAKYLENHLPVFFVDDLPSGSSEGKDIRVFLDDFLTNSNCYIIPLEGLARKLMELNIYEISVSKYSPYLRNYHYKREELDIFMFFNEDPYNFIETKVKIPVKGRLVAYDLLNDQLKEVDSKESSEGKEIELKLSPYESILILSGNLRDIEAKNSYSMELENEISIKTEWDISLSTAQQYPSFDYWKKIDRLENLSQPDFLPEFSGSFRYESKFNYNYKKSDKIILDLGNVYETADLWLNGKHIGVRICPPYTFDISSALKTGENTLTIDVTNTLVNEQKDRFSRHVQLEPSGLIGPIVLKSYI